MRVRFLPRWTMTRRNTDARYVLLAREAIQRDLRDEASQPRAPVPGSAGEALACALIVAGTKPGPTRQMPCRGKLRNVGSDLGDECTCGYAVDARNGVEQGHLLGKLHGVALDLPLEHCNLGFQPFSLCQQPPKQ